jgi:hypothetical protein
MVYFLIVWYREVEAPAPPGYGPGISTGCKYSFRSWDFLKKLGRLKPASVPEVRLRPSPLRISFPLCAKRYDFEIFAEKQHLFFLQKSIIALLEKKVRRIHFVSSEHL